MSVRTGMFPPSSVGPAAPGMPGPMPPMGAAPNPFAPMPPMPLAGMPPPPPMGGMPPPPMPQAPMPQPSSAGLGSIAGSNAPRRRMFGDFLESKLSSGQPRPAPQAARPPQMQQQQRMVAPGTPAMRTPPMQSMTPRPMMYGGEVDVFGYDDGGAVPRQTMIGDDPHMLAYINPEEAQLLKDLGGTGEPGPGGIPAYRPSDFAAERTGTGSYSHATDGDDDNKTSSSVAAANAAAAASMLSAGVGNVGGSKIYSHATDNDDDVDDVFGTGNIFTETSPGASTVNFGTGNDDDVDDTFGTGNIFTETTKGASTVDFGTGTGSSTGSSGSGSGGGDTTVYTPPPVYVPPVYTDSRGKTYSSQAEADAANRAIDAFNAQLMSYGAGKEAFNRFADKVNAQVPYASREDSDRAASQIYSTRYTPELAGYSGPDILGGIYSNISGIGSSDLGTGDDFGNLTAQPIVDSSVGTSQSPSQQLEQYGIDDDIFNLNPQAQESTLSQAVRSDVGQDYTPTSAELAAQLANANLPDLRQSQFDVDMSQPKTIDPFTQSAFEQLDLMRKEAEEKFARDGDQSDYDESIAAFDQIERDSLATPFDNADFSRERKAKWSYMVDAGDFDGTILGEGEGGMPRNSGANNRPADAGLGRGAGFKSLDQLKADISKVEGTDDDAGYNRLLDRGETGTFSGNKPLTEMTVAEAIEFGTSDAYRNYSRDALGRGPNELPSTPMGKYQIVGTTLKDLVDRGLVDPNAQFDADTQEQIGSLLVKNRGYDDVLSGKITEEQFLSNLGKEFEGVKKNENFNLSGGSVDQTGINQVNDTSTSRPTDDEVVKAAIAAAKPGASEDETAKIKAQLDASVPVQGFGKFIANVGKGLFLGLGADFVQGLVDKTEAERANIVEMHINAINNGATPQYDDDGKYIGYDNSTTATFGQKVLSSDNIMEFMPPGPDNPDAVDGGANEAFQTLYDAQSKAAELDPYGMSTESGFITSDGEEYVVTSDGKVIKVEDGVVGTGESILNSGVGVGTEVAGIFGDGDDTDPTSGDDDNDTTTTTTEVDTGYTTDESGNKICNQAGYVYDVATDACVPAAAEEESTDTSLNVGSGASRSFEDVLKNIQTKATTIAPISANIKPMAQGGMAGLNRTADNFLRALGG